MGGNPNLTSGHVRRGDFRQAHLSQTLPGTARPGSAGVPPALAVRAIPEPSFPRKRGSTCLPRGRNPRRPALSFAPPAIGWTEEPG